MNTIDSRKKIIENIPLTYLTTKHLKGSTLLESRLALLERLPKGLRCLECGVAQGKFSHEILTRMKPSLLDLVDLWEGARYGSGFDVCKDRFKESIEAGVIQLHKSKSVDYLRSCRENSYDFIYIDTDHSFGTTYSELCLSARVLTKDGFLAGHDYTVGNILTPVVYGVIQEVSKFCVEYEFCIKYLTAEPGGWNSFCLTRIKND